ARTRPPPPQQRPQQHLLHLSATTSPETVAAQGWAGGFPPARGGDWYERVDEAHARPAGQGAPLAAFTASAYLAGAGADRAALRGPAPRARSPRPAAPRAARAP